MTKDVAGHEKEVANTPNQSYRHLPWLRLPAPVKAIFDQFPLVSYDRNELPFARTGPAQLHILYTFTTEEDARAGAPSFNPTCLKWQAYLRFRGVRFVTHPSSNHASPSGALPFLLTSSESGAKSAPVPTRQLRAWAEREGSAVIEKDKERGSKSIITKNGDSETLDMRYEAYTSLLDNRVRSAYLHTLYIYTPNFIAITRPLYVESTTSSASVRIAQAQQLRNIARSELLKQSAFIDVEAIYRECDSAFEALSALLGESAYFFGKADPGLLDAAVFGYTNLLLDTKLQWKETRMRDALGVYQNLVKHRERILEDYFSAS